MARKILTGDKELEATLRKLSDKAADRVARNTLGAGLTVINKAQRQAAPVGPTGNLKANIGKRNERNKRSGVFEAKTGVGVGKKSTKIRKGIVNAPHGHLVALGSQSRTRKAIGGKFSYLKNPTQQQLSTGTMPSNPFIKQAYESARGTAESRMKKAAEKSLAREAAKAAKRTRSN